MLGYLCEESENEQANTPHDRRWFGIW
jgi:hypothetical protein